MIGHPFTSALLVSMLAVAWWTGTVFTRLSPEALEHFGCSPADLFSTHAWCALASVPFTWGGLSFLGLLPLVVASVGLCERAFGTARTATLFLATHLFAGLCDSVLIHAAGPLIGSALSNSLLAAPDVGPSVGCFGCVGALIAQLTGAKRARAAMGLVLCLVAIAFWRPDPGFATSTLWISDLSHLTGALAGYAWARWTVSESHQESVS